MKTEKTTPEQKQECLLYALTHPEIALKQLAADFGVGYSTLLKWVSRAKSAAYCAEEGDACMGTFDYEQAANHYKDAAEQYPIKVIQPESGYFNYQQQYAYAQACAGESQNAKKRLNEAIEVFSELGSKINRTQHPLPWAYLQNDIANTLSILGRLGDRRAVQHAVNKYRQVLTCFSRDQNPNEWGLTQQNLGKALTMLGSVRQDPLIIKAAIGAFREAADAGIQNMTEDQEDLAMQLDQASEEENTDEDDDYLYS